MATDRSPTITDADRGLLKERLVAHFKDGKTSGRKVEKRIGLPVGTISKICTGRVRLTLKVVKEIADVLAIGPDVLVEGTNFARVLLEAPETDATRELGVARAELDRLRAELAGEAALSARLRADLDAERCGRELAEGASHTAQLKLAASAQELAHAKAALGDGQKQITQSQRAVSGAQQEQGRLQAELDRLTAVSSNWAAQAHKWRESCARAMARVDYLESELATMQATLRKQGKNATGRTLLATLAALGIGVALGGNSDGT